jgi:hypothetical protein
LAGNVRQLENLTNNIVVRGDESNYLRNLKGPIPAPAAAGLMALPVNLDDDNFTLRPKLIKVVS